MKSSKSQNLYFIHKHTHAGHHVYFKISVLEIFVRKCHHATWDLGQSTMDWNSANLNWLFFLSSLILWLKSEILSGDFKLFSFYFHVQELCPHGFCPSNQPWILFVHPRRLSLIFTHCLLQHTSTEMLLAWKLTLEQYPHWLTTFHITLIMKPIKWKSPHTQCRVSMMINTNARNFSPGGTCSYVQYAELSHRRPTCPKSPLLTGVSPKRLPKNHTNGQNEFLNRRWRPKRPRTLAVKRQLVTGK